MKSFFPPEKITALSDFWENLTVCSTLENSEKQKKTNASLIVY